MARFQKKSMAELQRLSISEMNAIPHNNIQIILDNVRSRNNVGAIFRTADAFRVAHIYLCGFTPRPPHRDIFKTALGATETIPWSYHENISLLLSVLKKKPRHQIWALEQTHNSTPLQDFNNITDKGQFSLILGNEVKGVSNEALAFCEGSLEIPQWGHKHSFNISVSTGIALWEICRKFYL